MGALDARGDGVAIQVPSLAGADSIGAWDASTLPILLLGPLVAVFAMPGVTARRRMLLGGWAATLGLLAMAFVCGVQVEAAVANYAATQGDLEVHSDLVRGLLQTAQEGIGILVFGLPAAAAAAAYWARSPSPAPWLESPLAHLALGSLGILFGLLAMAPVGPVDAGHVGARLERHVERNPQSVLALRALGLWMQRERGATAALPVLERALRADPSDATSAQLLATALASAGRAEQSLRVYERAIEANPRDLTTRYNFGVALTQLGRRDEALETYEAILAIDPEHRPARRAAGLSRAAAGEPCRALEWLQPIADDDAVRPHIALLRAQCDAL